MTGTDHDLLGRWRAGDLRAGDELFGRHFESLYRFFSTKVGDAAADLVQQTLLACVERRDTFREDAAFRTFLFAIARKRLYSHFERGPRDRTRHSVEEMSVRDLGGSPPSQLAAREEERLLLRALREIPMQHQIILELHFWEKLTGPELAVVLDVPEGTVRSRLRLAKHALKAKAAELDRMGRALDTTMDDLERWASALAQQLRPPVLE